MLLLGGGTIFGFGYAVAVMHRANSDYKKTKEGLPGMRKAYWQSWWTSVKRGTFIAVALSMLIIWVVTSNDNDADATPRPSPSPSKTARHHK